MHLKTLSIKGFKSFADHAALELEPGVTVVVGPNGSGKSNVVDAMAWVLGAQKPSAVRSQTMNDVIFAGTAKKAALGRAEVALTIDNNDGVLPIEFNEVTITRTLFRSGESEYAINGVTCRLLDIQDLLSDSGVGRQQHIIISQGQIDAVLNARPEERRAIVEEAAGVLKYRKRKERAERRLAATEENLNRLGDLVREVRRQLRPLEKQADAARRHGDLVAELSALKLYLSGRELTALRGRLEQSHRQRAEFDRSETELTGSLAGLDAAVLDAEAELAALGGSDVAEVLARARSLRERMLGQTKVLAERRRRLEGELRSSVDEGVVASLEAEAARIVADLVTVADDQARIEPLIAELEAAEAQLETDRAAFAETWGEGVGPAPAQAAEVRAQVTALESAAERDRQERTRVIEQLEALGSRHDRLMVTRDEAQATAETRRTELAELEPRLVDVETAVGDTEAAVETAEAARRDADGEASRWQARSDALRQALDAARSAAGVDTLAEIDGVLGTLLDLIDVDSGYEAAVEAAAGEALRAVVVDDVDRARNALDELVGADLAGAVLALGSMPAELRPHAAGSEQRAGGTGGKAARSLVRATRPDVEPLLDRLLDRAIVLDTDWRSALDLALSRPDLTVVTKAGDRFGPTGWRVGQGGAGATGAALDEATEAAVAAAEAATAAETAYAEARTARDAARAEVKEIEKALAAARVELDKATATDERSAGQLAELAVDRERLDRQLAEIAERTTRDQAELETLQLKLPGLEADEEAHEERARTMDEERAALEAQSRTLAGRRRELEVEAASVTQRTTMLETRQGEVEGRLERLVAERAAAAARRVELERSLAVVDELSVGIEGRKERLQGWIVDLSQEQEAQSKAARQVSDQLSARRKERSAAEKQLVEVRERRSRLELSDAENTVRLETLTEAVRRELDTEPEVAMAAERPEVPDGSTPESRVRELERELKLLGPINPLALTEFEELKERHEFLDAQLNDVKSTRRDLQRLIREVDTEIVSVFSAAYADVATNFLELFQVLFPGGRGAVKLTEEEDLLNCGVEIEAKPSGKNVKKLSLLSGGERSLVALAFLFSVFKSRPSPFYVMDEVEAALDDMNLNRFLSLVEEFRKEAQLIIVSHQKKTMEAADVLYGVSMKPGGSSKVVSERAEAAKTIGA